MRTQIRRGAAAALAVSALFFTAACGGSSDKASDKSGEKPAGQEAPKKDDAAGAGALTEAQMTAATLELKDLPAGWKAGEITPPTTEDYKADNPDCQPIAAMMADKIAGATMGKPAEFEREAGSYQLSQRIYTFPGTTGAADHMKALGTSLDACPGFSVTEQGTTFEVGVKKLTTPKAGDASHAFRLYMEIAGMQMKFETDLFVVSQGAGATQIAFIPSDAAGHKDFDDLAKRAGDKFVKGAKS
ncbi:hypothetical protein [Streptomyces sp. NPDC000410]|uniref:hypothetical protein n=1 Tax=Streptomyces sp. NPDC000410 TaxID=3154254 RepID=UPI0033280CC7